jgi:hypothetical protein
MRRAGAAKRGLHPRESILPGAPELKYPFAGYFNFEALFIPFDFCAAKLVKFALLIKLKRRFLWQTRKFAWQSTDSAA